MGKTRKGWPEEEKRRIVELTLEPGVNAAQVAQSEGMNANRVFQWRRSYLNGELQACASTVLLPVVIGVGAAPVAEIASVPENAKTAQGGLPIILCHKPRTMHSLCAIGRISRRKRRYHRGVCFVRAGGQSQ